MMDEKIYKVAIFVILGMELILSIPLVIDSMMGRQGFEIVIILGILHIIMYGYGELFRVRNFHKKAHVLGIVAFMTSFLPFVGFVLHIVVSYIIIKGFNRSKKI